MDDNGSTHMIYAYEEVWQNQSWHPGFGYCAPITTISHFSDFSGENHFSSNEPPDVPLNPG